MNRGKRRSAGYTIVETMIFLAVSATMFVSAMALISGRQSRAEFNNSIREFQSAMEDVANDVSTGYYADTANAGDTIQCSAGSSGPVVLTASSAASTQGEKKGCIFIGKTLFFGTQEKGTAYYNLVPLVGRQWQGAAFSADVEDYTQAQLQAVAPAVGSSASFPDATQSTLLSGGVTVECAFYGLTALAPAAAHPCADTSNARNIDSVTFITTFHALDNSTGQAESGASHVDLLVSHATTALGRPQKTIINEIDHYASATALNAPYVNPTGGIYICLQSNGTNQHALVRLGGASSRFSADTTVEAGACL